MNKVEFLAWLEGYLAGGGKDIKVISEKLNKVYSEPVLPTYPIPVIPCPSIPERPLWEPYITWISDHT